MLIQSSTHIQIMVSCDVIMGGDHCLFACIVTAVHNRSVRETRQRKVTTPEDLFFQRKRAASDRTQTHNMLHTMQMLYQLSHRGSPTGQAESLTFMQGQRCLFHVRHLLSVFDSLCTCLSSLHSIFYALNLSRAVLAL